MNRFTVFLARIVGRDRRRENQPVPTDRRKRTSAKDAQERATRALDDFEQTLRMRREDFFDGKHERSSNDSQQVVLFPSLQQVCRFRGPDALKVRLCRHENHEDAANSALTICEESKCPIILEAVRGVPA